MLNEIRELGFAYAELGHGIRLSLVDGIQQAVSAGEIKISSVHNFCPLPLGVMGPAPDYYLPSSRRETERALAVRHTLRSIEVAASTGARAVVLHLGLVPMRNYTMRLVDLIADQRQDSRKFERLRRRALALREKKKTRFFDQVKRTLEAVAPRARELGVRLGIETRFGIEEIPNEQETADLIDQFGSDTVTYWHDVGHALVKEQLGLLQTESILDRFRGRMAGMHLQDFLPPAEDHLPPGHGAFDFGRLAPYVEADTVLAWEIHPRWEATEIIRGTQAAHAILRPMERTA